MRILLLVLIFGICGCGSPPHVVTPPGSAENTDRTLVMVVNGATVVVAALDLLEKQRWDANAKPTEAELAAGEVRVQRIERAFALMKIAQAWAGGTASADQGRAALRDAIAIGKLLIQELRADGITVRPELDIGLTVAEGYLQ